MMLSNLSLEIYILLYFAGNIIVVVTCFKIPNARRILRTRLINIIENLNVCRLPCAKGERKQYIQKEEKIIFLVVESKENMTTSHKYRF